MSDTKGQRAELSGRFVLRIDPGLHASLKKAAEVAGMSLNEYCARKLAAAPGNLGDPAAAAVVERAASLFGGALVGVAVFGSWARDELDEGSDVDLLVVVDDRVRITRQRYRHWDRSPLYWGGRIVEPHFVHAGTADRRITGLWAEVAVDGVVLFDRGCELSRRLSHLRRDIVAGRIVRRRVHGQPYWVEAA
ncbi:MAG: toxin-antitoxin system HicB family antitoxin [Acidobacteriota bacterium]